MQFVRADIQDPARQIPPESLEHETRLAGAIFIDATDFGGCTFSHEANPSGRDDGGLGRAAAAWWTIRGGGASAAATAGRHAPGKAAAWR
jgi:hypothetical protein